MNTQYTEIMRLITNLIRTGTPDWLTLRARRADFRQTLNTKCEKSWHQTSVSDVVKEIAGRHKLKTAIGDDGR